MCEPFHNCFQISDKHLAPQRATSCVKETPGQRRNPSGLDDELRASEGPPGSRHRLGPSESRDRVREGEIAGRRHGVHTAAHLQGRALGVGNAEGAEAEDGRTDYGQGSPFRVFPEIGRSCRTR